MKVIIRDSKKEASIWAAHHIADAIKAKAEMPQFRAYLIINEYFTLAYVVAIVYKSGKDASAKTEIFVVGLKNAAEPSITDMLSELYPYWVFGIIEKYGWCNLTIIDELFFTFFILPDHRHNTIRP